MRSIETQETREVRRKRRQVILSVILIVILMGSTAGYAISLIADSGAEDPANYDEPYFNGAGWVVPAGGRLFLLQSGPEETKNVSLEGVLSGATYQGKTVYLVAESETIKQELAGVLGAFAQRLQEACYGSCESSELPEKDCSSLVVIWTPSEERRIYTNESCVFIEGDYVAVDAFLYRLLGYN